MRVFGGLMAGAMFFTCLAGYETKASEKHVKELEPSSKIEREVVKTSHDPFAEKKELALKLKEQKDGAYLKEDPYKFWDVVGKTHREQEKSAAAVKIKAVKEGKNEKGWEDEKDKLAIEKDQLAGEKETVAVKKNQYRC